MHNEYLQHLSHCIVGVIGFRHGMFNQNISTLYQQLTSMERTLSRLMLFLQGIPLALWLVLRKLIVYLLLQRNSWYPHNRIPTQRTSWSLYGYQQELGNSQSPKSHYQMQETSQPFHNSSLVVMEKLTSSTSSFNDDILLRNLTVSSTIYMGREPQNLSKEPYGLLSLVTISISPLQTILMVSPAIMLIRLGIYVVSCHKQCKTSTQEVYQTPSRDLMRFLFSYKPRKNKMHTHSFRILLCGSL